MVNLGQFVDSGEPATIDFGSSRRVLICGKTGSGKSYTVGVLLEELERDQDVILLVVDPQGVYWTMAQPNDKQESEIYSWGEVPRGLPVTVLVPGDPVYRYGGSDVVQGLENRGVHITSLRLNPADVTEEMWCDLFDLDINELQGITMSRAVRNARLKLKSEFFIPDIIDEVKRTNAIDKTKEAVIRKLEMAADWDIFESVRYRDVWEILSVSGVNILDLSVLDQAKWGLRNLAVAVLARFIFRQRTIARRKEALNLATQMPRVWMAIDEAQNFCPAGSSTLAKDILIRWAKEGRQPGLSLVVASQQPGSVDSEILSQCDLRIVHKITSREDLKAINALSEDYMDRDIQSYIHELSNVGEAVLIDDKRERVERVRIRPRVSEHGGDSR